MGLLLSILVFSVGVLEALACVRHIQQGILPAWAPRHVTTVTGRQLLRERWRKSTSQDDGSGDVSGDVPQANGVPSRHLPASRQRSIEEEHLGKPRPPPLTLSESPLHHVRSPDIHWPEPLPHSPVKCDEHTLPSPVPEVPGDAPAWPSVPPPEPEVALLQRRRTSTTETLPEEDQRHAKPLRDATPEPSFAREGREPSRLKPAKASSFEEARFEPFALPESKAPEVISLSYSDFTSAGPRTAVVGRMEIKATKDESEDGVTPWPIVNIDTVVTPDEEGDVTPPANVASRRVSFDPVPTVVLIDKEKTVAEEKQHGVVLAPSIKITDDLEGVLRKELPSVIDEIIEEALLKTNSILDARQNGAFSGVSLILETLVAKGDDVLIRPLADGNVQESQNHIASDVETFVGQIYKDNVPKIPLDDTITHSRSDVYQNKDDVTKAVQDVLDAKVTRPTRLEDEPLEQSPRMETLLSEDGAQKLECRSQRSFTEVDDEEVPIVSEDSSYLHPNECKSVAVPEDINLASSPRVLSEDSIGIATDLLGYSEQSTKDTIEPSLREDEHETRNENKLRNEASEDIAPQHPAGKQPTPRREIEAPKADEEREAVVNGPPSIPVAPEGLVGKIVAEPVPSFDSSASTLESTITPETPQASNALVSPISIESSVTSASSDILDAISAPPDIPVTSSPSPALVHGSHDIPTVATSALPTKSVSIDSSVPTVPTSSFSATSPSPTAAAPVTHAVPGVNTPTSSTDSESTGSSLPKPSASAACAQPAIKAVLDTPCQSTSVSPHSAASATSASATTQKSAITPAAARAGDPSSESSGSSSSDRSAAGGRVAAPAAAKAPAAPQQEAFWVSDASSSPHDSSARPVVPVAPDAGAPDAAHATMPGAGAAASPTTANAPSSPDYSRLSRKIHRSFESAKASFTAASSKASPVFPKPLVTPKKAISSGSPTKQVSPASPAVTSSKHSSFSGTAALPSPSLSKPASSPLVFPIPEVSSLPLPSVTSHSSILTSSSIPRTVPDSPALTNETVGSSGESASTTADTSSSAPAPSPSVSSRPMPSSPPRNPQELVRRIAELRRTDPTVASEVLLSILGFKYPSS